MVVAFSFLPCISHFRVDILTVQHTVGSASRRLPAPPFYLSFVQMVQARPGENVALGPNPKF